MNDILEEAEIDIQGLTSGICKQRKLNCGAQRHHYSMFNVGRSMFDVQFFKTTLYVENATCECR
jgi:hypothetical protein